MFSYFESSVDGIIPNEYSSLEAICAEIFACIAAARDSCMLTARRFWLAQQLVTPEISKFFNFTTPPPSTTTSLGPSISSTTKLLDSEKDIDQSRELITKMECYDNSSAALSEASPMHRTPNNLSNSNKMLNNLNSMNKRDNDKALIITNNELLDDMVRHADGHMNKFKDNAKSQETTKKQN